MKNDERKLLIARIAREQLRLETIQTRNCDDLDFHSLAVWRIEAALEAAFAAGVASATAPVATTSRSKKAR